MQLLVFTVLGLLSFHIKAFEITIYNNVNHCDANDDSMYRIISGASDGACHTFDEAMPGTVCSQYNKGGGEGHTGCTSESLLPVSVLQTNGNIPCKFYSQRGCQGTLNQAAEMCVDAGILGFSRFRSFSCEWDQRVDILGNVGCRAAVSTSVCVNDCNCACNGMILLCPPKSLRCTPEGYALCEEFCTCTNP